MLRSDLLRCSEALHLCGPINICAATPLEDAMFAVLHGAWLLASSSAPAPSLAFLEMGHLGLFLSSRRLLQGEALDSQSPMQVGELRALQRALVLSKRDSGLLLLSTMQPRLHPWSTYRQVENSSRALLLADCLGHVLWERLYASDRWSAGAIYQLCGQLTSFDPASSLTSSLRKQLSEAVAVDDSIATPLLRSLLTNFAYQEAADIALQSLSSPAPALSTALDRIGFAQTAHSATIEKLLKDEFLNRLTA